MGDDEYRGFYIEVPRPTPEEWGDVEELIASGNMTVGKRFLQIGLHSTRWRPGGSMSLQADTGIPGQSVLRTGNGPVYHYELLLSVRMRAR